MAKLNKKTKEKEKYKLFLNIASKMDILKLIKYMYT